MDKALSIHVKYCNLLRLIYTLHTLKLLTVLDVVSLLLF
jgi:hypothetical protein